MSRKDIIIVAAFINACLLAVLFVSALKSDHSPPVVQAESFQDHSHKMSVDTKTSHAAVQSGNQIEQVLNQYSTHLKGADGEKKEATSLVTSLAQNTSKEGEKKGPSLSLAKKEESHAPHTITVEKGDVLERLAKTHGVTVDAIIALNHLSSTNF